MTIRWWKIPWKGDPRIHEKAFFSGWSSDGKRIAVTFCEAGVPEDFRTAIGVLKTGQIGPDYVGVSSVAMSSEMTALVMRETGCVEVLGGTRGNCRRQLAFPAGDGGSASALSEDGKHLAIAIRSSGKGKLLTWDLSKAEMQFKDQPDCPCGVDCQVAYVEAPDAIRVVGPEDPLGGGKLLYWDTQSLGPGRDVIAEVKLEPPHRWALSPDGSSVLLAGRLEGETVLLPIALPSLKVRQTLSLGCDPDFYVHQVSVSREGRWAAFTFARASDPGYVLVVDTVRGKLVARHAPDEHLVDRGVLISTDGSRVLWAQGPTLAEWLWAELNGRA